MQRALRLPGGLAVSLPGRRGRKRMSRLAMREALSAYGFVLPYLLVMGVFLLISTGVAFVLSFFYVDFGFTQPIWYGLNNYQHIWYDLTHNGDFAVGLLNVLKYTVGVVVLQTIVALALALLLNRKVRGRGVFRTAYYLPALTSSVAISIIFLWLYKPLPEGGINYVLSLVGIHGPNWLGDPNFALYAVMLLNIWTTAPTFMLVYLAALQDIPETVYEAARIDGANAWQQITRITIPLLRPTTFVVTALGTIGAFQVFDQIFVMQGADGGPLRSTLVPVLSIYNTAFKSSLMGLACAQAVVLFVVIFTFTFLQRRFIDVNLQY